MAIRITGSRLTAPQRDPCPALVDMAYGALTQLEVSASM
jgi:hypothetical protein